MKRSIGVAVATTVALAAGAGGGTAQVSEIGAGEGAVSIVAWPGYVERGDTDKNYDWVSAFEQETACKVNVKTAGTSDEMVSLMTQGGYDLVTASGDASIRGVGDWHDRLRPGVARRIPGYTKACSLESHLPERAAGATAVPMADATDPIVTWWVNRRTDPGPAPTDRQLHAAATAARRVRGGAR